MARGPQHEDAPEPTLAAVGGLGALRDLLLAPERERLAGLQARQAALERGLEALRHERAVSAEAVAGVLPEAVARRGPADPALSGALSPSLQAALRTAVEKDPAALAQAIFPVLGPAIRKAIAQALRELVESFNQVLENSLTPRGLRWRLEAWRTGRPFAEVALLHSLVYRVEQVFLIHRRTGLPLLHEAAPAVAGQDPDLVAGMLTAIQDFVRDSFSGGEGDGLDSLRVGGLRVWVERGPEAVLAAVVRGQASPGLGALLQETLEQVHVSHRAALAGFDGDPAPFEPGRPLLQACLQSHYRGEGQSRRPAWFAWLALLLVLASAGYWGWQANQGQRRWTGFLDELRATPGIVLLHAAREGERYRLTGLRDPLAAEPEALAAAHGIAPDRLQAHWTPYHDLAPPFVLARAAQALSPPASVRLGYAGGVLRAEGEAAGPWIERSGWLAPLIPGVREYRAEGLVDADLRRLQHLAQEVGRYRILFARGSHRPAERQGAVLERLAEELGQTLALADRLGVGARVQALGHADRSGGEALNRRLSLRRAEALKAALVARGLPAERIQALGMGASLQQALDGGPSAPYRSAELRVLLGAGPEG